MSRDTDSPAAATGHRPVMAAEVVRELITDPSGTYLDATLGGGGHAELILEHLDKAGRLIGIDRDERAVRSSAERLSRFGDRVIVRYADYRQLAGILQELGVERLNGALFDLGLSSLQLDDPARGFAYRLDGPLDLRFDTSRGQTAASWLANASEEEIGDALRGFGEEPNAKRLARVIVTQRTRQGAITTTGQLTELIGATVGRHGAQFGRTAARVFQALRIVVNDELSAIPAGIEATLDRLATGARLVVVSYHSGEDRIVKNLFREASRLCRCPRAYGRCVCGANTRGRLVQRRVLRPGDDEVARNPRAKSARMRVLERIDNPGRPS